MGAAPEPPVGTIALLFTDIEGSTSLAARLVAAWPAVLEQHHELVDRAIAAEGGFVDGTEGDAFFATFTDPAAAARAAVAAQRGLSAHAWGDGVGELRVRMGLHVGYVERTVTGYVGLEVHRAARVGAAAHGGQLLLTSAARELIGDAVATESVGVHRLKDFPSPVQLFTAVIDGRGAGAFPPPRTQTVRPTNLPSRVAALVGREPELEQIQDALMKRGERLITLTGRGGAGKTSLALTAGSRLLEDHTGGVWWANLAAAGAPEDVGPTIAASVGAERKLEGSPLQAIEAHLAGRGPTLVIVDNFEHVLAAAGVLSELLDALPELRLLVTSQAPLHDPLERVIALDALDDEAALTLIGQVARRRGGPAGIEDGHRAALLDVVRLLDGLPLALELAAARLSLLSPAQLVERLRQSPDVLTDAGGARPERQRSLRATVEWSLALLDAQARELFVRMGTFAGPVELDEIEEVAGGDGLDVMEALATLLDVALVRRVEFGDGRLRFALPEALRQIASDRLDRAPDGATWRQAHARRQHELLWAARTTFTDVATYRAATEADPEAAAALLWCRTTSDPLAAPIAAARAHILAVGGRLRDAIAAVTPVIESPPADPAVHCLACAADALALLTGARHAEAVPLSEEALRVAEDQTSRCLALINRGLVAVFGGDAAAAVRNHERATAIARELDPCLLVGALMMEAQSQLAAGALDQAAARISEAETIGAPIDASALRYVDTLTGDLAMAQNRPAEALEPYARSLEHAETRADAMQTLFDLQGMASAFARLGHYEDAVEVSGLGEMQGEDVGGPGLVGVAHLLGAEAVVAARERLDPAVAERCRARGRSVPAGMRVTRARQLAKAHQPV